jgi:hypothetical protein
MLLGLFVGCLMTDFLKEVSWELFRNSEVYFSMHSSCLLSISLSVYNLELISSSSSSFYLFIIIYILTSFICNIDFCNRRKVCKICVVLNFSAKTKSH